MPSAITLKKYGLSADEWQNMWDKQQGICPICLKPMTRAVIDHKHVKGWKQLPASERKKFVRSLLCWYDNNKILTKGVTPERLERAAQYLREWENKKPT